MRGKLFLHFSLLFEKKHAKKSGYTQKWLRKERVCVVERQGMNWDCLPVSLNAP
jgi:hypothetical protein